MINLFYLLNPSSCAHFCIRHIFKEYKVKNKDKYLKDYMSVSEIIKILSFNNFKCFAYKNVSLENLGMLNPVLTLVSSNNYSYHYIIIKRIDLKYVYYYDPLYVFDRKIKIKDFYKRWTKIIIKYTYIL